MEVPASFARDIQPLFRPKDRDEMVFVFDLWNVEDVRENAESILDRLDHGDMPCDDPWPAELIQLFQQWMEAGMPA